MPAPAPCANTSRALAPRGARNKPETLPAFALAMKRIGFAVAILIGSVIALNFYRLSVSALFIPSAEQIPDRHEKHKTHSTPRSVDNVERHWQRTKIAHGSTGFRVIFFPMKVKV
jgi:hypothetical protein